MLKDFPFQWQLRLSKRAKRPRITISRIGQVELVWPHRMAQKYVAQMLAEHEAWVLKQLDKLPTQKPQSVVPPEAIYLQAISQTYKVTYTQQAGRLKLKEIDDMLYISGDLKDAEALRLVLNHWVKMKGKTHLIPWLKAVSDEMGLNYVSVAIRLQKRRWGSCSVGKRINLNAALLFLPEHLVEHVLVHELAHLKHLNHSAAFWAEVAQYDVDYKTHKKALKHKDADVPAWLTQPFTSIEA